MAVLKPKVDRDEVDPSEPESPAMAVPDTVQPLQVEGGEGKIHEMAARHARVAMKQALVEAGRHVTTAANPRPVIRRYPWASLGAAAAVGFATAVAVVPSEKQRAASRLKAIDRALRTERNFTGGTPRRGKPPLTKRLMLLGWRFAKPTLLSMVTSAATGAATGAASGAAAAEESHAEGPMPPPDLQEPGARPGYPDVT